MIPVYLTNPSQEYSYDTPGNDDEKTFLVKFVGTHPGTELEALEFSKNLLEEPFLVLIPGCEKNAPGKLLGQPNNPMIFTSTHKASKDGDKFNFNFEQRVGSEFIYFSYGGIISLPPGGDDPDIPVPPSPGFDPTKWARRDASNIDGDNVLLWREALRIVGDSASLSTKAEKDGSNITDTITWRTALDIYNKSEVNSKFINNTSESLTSIEQPTLVGNVLTLKYVGENGIIQEETVDLSNLATIDIHIEDASYNASTNILTITDTEGVEYNVDLSEFSILTSTNASGITTLTQEGVNKLIVSKVGQTGNFPDLLNKPTTLSGYGITDAMSTSHAANIITSTNINNWNTAFGWGNHATAGYLSAVDLNNYVTLNTAQTITGLKNFSNGFDINSYQFRGLNSNVLTIGKNVFGNSLSKLVDSSIAVGNNVFPSMNLQPFDPVTEPWNNKGYFGIGSDIFVDYTGDSKYRPDHNAHDSWIGLGRYLGAGFKDGTNVNFVGTAIMHKNDVKYADCVTIVGKGFSNGIKTRPSKTLDPNRVVLSKNGYNVHGMMSDVIGMGHENWIEDINQSIVLGSNLRPYTYVFNSLVLGHHHANMNFEGTTEQADMYLDSDVIMGMGVGKRSSRHAPSHNLLVGMDYFYSTGGAPNANYRPLIEGRFKDGAQLQVNGTIIGGFEKLDDDLPYLERVTFESVSLPKGVVYNASERSFTFDGTQASTSITLHNVPANPNRYVYLEISSSNHKVGSWGYSFYNIVDSGNGPTDNFIARQSFKMLSPTTFILTTEGNFKGTIHIICDYTDVTLRSINPNILLKDSKERKTFEIRTTQDPSIVSMGLNSGRFLTHGGKTLILGNDILAETPSATNNVLVGNNILKFGSNVLNNIIVGNTIGGNNTKLTQSVIIGNNTLQSNFTNTVGRITSVGNGAGKVLTDGIYNNFFGENAGSSLITGSNNAFFGSGSGLIKEGSNNTFIGHVAGGHGLTQSTVNNTIVIGANAAPEVPNNTTTIATASNTDNFLYGTTHSNLFKVRGGLATQVMMADGTLKDQSALLSTGNYVSKTGTNNISDNGWKLIGPTNSGIYINEDGYFTLGSLWNTGSRLMYDDEGSLSISSVGPGGITLNGGTNGIDVQSYISSNNYIKATSFIKTGGTNNNVLLDGGGVKPISDFGKTYVAGDGISITGANNVITNTKPNVVQTLSGSGNTINLSNGGSYTIPAQSWGSITGKPEFNFLNSNPQLTYGASGLNYFNIANVAGNDPKLNQAPTNAWHHIIRMNHSNSGGNYADLAISMTDNSGISRRVINGGAAISDWVKLWDSSHFTQSNINNWNTAFNNNHSHSNKANLDTINQNLGTAYSPTFQHLNLAGNLNTGGLNYFHNQLGGQPSISVAIGDTDTGFNWEGDGVISYYANAVKLFNLNNVWHSSNFNPDGKANALENATGIGLASGQNPNVDNTYYPYFNTTYGYIPLATRKWVADTYIPKSHPVYNITQANINLWNTAQTLSVSQSTTNTQINISRGNSISFEHRFLGSFDGSRNPTDIKPNTSPKSIRADFAAAGTVGGTGNYAGVLTYAPWYGTSASTGDSSYQLAFINETGINGSGNPGLRLRKGIDETWGSWISILTSVNGVTLDTVQTITGVKTFSNNITAPAFYESSLKSLKKNIKEFKTSGLDLVGDLNIVTFDRKDESAKNKIGIIADDSPKEFLSEELDAVDLYKTVFIQAKAIQELTEEVNNLRELVMTKLNQL